MPKKSPKKGNSAILVSTLLFSISSVLVKHISSSFSGTFITLIRFIVGISAGILILRLLKKSFSINNPRSWFMRGLFGSVSMCTFYCAIAVTSSGRAVLLSNTYPVFVVLFGYLFFRQPITVYDVVSLVLCITGSAFVLYDGSNYHIGGDLIALFSAATSGIAIHYIKESSKSDHPIIVYLATCFFGLLIAPVTMGEWRSISYSSGTMLVFLGLLTFMAQIIMTWGYRCQ